MPSTIPTIPSADTISATVRYSLERIDGTEFTPELAINGSGIITIDSTTNIGTARYFVRVKAIGYNTRNVLLTISVLNVDFEGKLSYNPSYEFTIGSDNTIMPNFPVSIPDTETRDRTILYSLTRISGTEFDPEPAIAEDSGAITVNQFGNEGTATYLVRAEATDYNGQETTLNISIVKANFTGTLSYNVSYEFTVGSDNTIIPNSPLLAIPPADTRGVTVRYSLTRDTGTGFVFESSIDSGTITVNQVDDAGTATYLVRAEATGYNTQETTLDISIVKANFTGTLSYKLSHEFTVGSDNTITPTGTLAIPPTDTSGKTIRYSFTRSTGTEFVFESSIDDGVITISQISNAGTARYLVRAEATGYNPQEVPLDITIMPAGLEGALSYKLSHEFIAGSDNTIVPTGTPSIPSTGASNATILYSLAISTGTMFNPEPSINENNGIITVNPISNTGTATYIIQALATGYSAQEVTLTITVIGNANAGMIQVSTYYSGAGGATDILPVALGQAVEDDGMFSLADNDVILSVPNLSAASYTIHFGPEPGTYSRSYQKTASGGTITILKSELTTNSFSFADGAVIGISGSGITGTQHVATYHPSNIYKHQDLQAIRKDLDRNYIVKRDIVFAPMTDSTGTAVSNYETVGDDSNPFVGSIDGSGHIISGIEIVSTDNYQGIFGVMEGSTLNMVMAQDFVLRDFKITGNAVVGSLAGQVKRGTVDNVSVEVSGVGTGKVEVSGETTIDRSVGGFGGGLLGCAGTGATDTEVRVQNTSSAVAVSGTGTNSNQIGGLVGQVRGDVELIESFATGVVSGNDHVGGLVGSNSGTVTGSTTGVVSGNDHVGGLVGSNSGTVTGSTTGVVSGNNEVGGLVGHNNTGAISGSATGSVSGNDQVGGLVGQNDYGGVIGYATGDVSGNGDFAGGLVGQNDYGRVRGYVTGNVSGDGSIGGLVGLNTGTVTGYAKGVVSGNNEVGGLVGLNAEGAQMFFGKGVAIGYARSVVRRSSGTSDDFGKVIGYGVGGVATMIYSSADSSMSESQIYNGLIGTSPLTNTSGSDGTAVTVDGTTTQSAFPDFVFAPELDDQGDPSVWIWVGDGKWPAIDIGEIKPANEQPVDP